MSYQPKHLGHVNIYVRNVERSHKWYSDLFGLHTYAFYPGRAAFMSADLDKSHEVALIEVGEDAPGQHPGEVAADLLQLRLHVAEALVHLRVVGLVRRADVLVDQQVVGE